jgi:hypothetical protein
MRREDTQTEEGAVTLQPLGFDANNRLCRLLPQGLDWHFHAFCAALESVTVPNLPSLMLLSYPFSA